MLMYRSLIMAFLILLMTINSYAQIGMTRAEIVHQLGTNYNESHDENGLERITCVTYPSADYGTYKETDEYCFDGNEICNEYISVIPLLYMDITVAFLNKTYQSINYNVWYDKQYNTIIKLFPMTESNVMVTDYKRQ